MFAVPCAIVPPTPFRHITFLPTSLIATSMLGGYHMRYLVTSFKPKFETRLREISHL